MATNYNTPNHSFVIQISTPTGEHAGYMRIDQAVNPKNRRREQERVRNSTEQRLNELHNKTRCDYLVIYEGNPEMATAILKAEADSPF